MAQPAFNSTAKVLIVEDNPARLKAISLPLETDPEFEVAAAFQYAQEAIFWLSRKRMDVLLVNLHLPNGSAIKVIRACRKFHPDCDIMVLTSCDQLSDIITCIEAGAPGYLLKNSDTFSILRALKEIRGSGASISPTIAKKIIEHLRTKNLPDESVTAQDEVPGPRLTKREGMILGLVARGDSHAEVADGLFITVRTVETHMKNIYAKLRVNSRGEAVFKAQKTGLLAHWH